MSDSEAEFSDDQSLHSSSGADEWDGDNNSETSDTTSLSVAPDPENGEGLVFNERRGHYFGASSEESYYAEATNGCLYLLAETDDERDNTWCVFTGLANTAFAWDEDQGGYIGPRSGILFRTASPQETVAIENASRIAEREWRQRARKMAAPAASQQQPAARLPVSPSAAAPPSQTWRPEIEAAHRARTLNAKERTGSTSLGPQMAAALKRIADDEEAFRRLLDAAEAEAWEGHQARKRPRV